jgi:hypothetical protein
VPEEAVAILRRREFIAAIGGAAAGCAPPVHTKETACRWSVILRLGGQRHAHGVARQPAASGHTCEQRDTSGSVVIDTHLLAKKELTLRYATGMLAMANYLFDLALAGKIVSELKQSFALVDATEAHRALEVRKTVGATVLVP